MVYDAARYQGKCDSKELDLSYNAMSTEACEGIMQCMLQNHTIRRLSLRGNKMDDNISDALFDLII